MFEGKKLEVFKSMYPSAGYMLENEIFSLPEFCKFCSIYGYSYGNSSIEVDGKVHKFEQGQYFGLSVFEQCKITALDKLFVVVRLGYLVPNTVGWVE